MPDLGPTLVEADRVRSDATATGHDPGGSDDLQLSD